MKERSIKVLRPLSLALVLILIVGLAGSGGPFSIAALNDPPETGIICTTNVSDTFTLTAHEGTISTPDGNIVYMWGFSAGADAFQHPSPVLCVDEGVTVTVVLHNLLAEDISIIFPGQENVMANGQPSQPQFDGSGNLTSLAPVAPPDGTMTYSFVASKPGTFLYQSGTEPLKQVNMGLFGGLVVRPALGDAYAYNDPGTRLKTEADGDGYRAEYLLIFSEIDPMLHMAVEQGLSYNMNNYRPRYWMINGRSFPDTVAPNGALWLPDQPYGSLTYIHPYDAAANPYPALIRYINVGTENFPHHPHGNHGRIIAQDGNLLAGDAGQDMSYEKFTINTGPGQTYDELFIWEDVDKWRWNPGEPDHKPIPVTIPQLQNLTFGTFYSGSPYLGNTDNLPVGHQALNECGEYYHIAHNHALQQITAWGVVLSGHITFARIDPPLGPDNECE